MIRFPLLARPWSAVMVLGVAAAVIPQSFLSAQPPGSPERAIEAGLSVNDSRAYQGYSLVAPMNSTTTYLIDMDGQVVNRWKSDFTPALSAYLLENGHLLRPGAQRGGSIGGAGAGGRVQEFSWDGELLWDFSLSTERNLPHHDICPMPNGNVLMIVWDKKTTEEAIAAGRIPGTVQGQFLPDCILEVRPTGKTSGEVVWEWHAWDHLIQEVDETKPNYGEVSEHPELIDVNFGTHVMASMISDPEQLAKLRSLGYVGGGRQGPGGPDGNRGPGSDSGGDRQSDGSRQRDGGRGGRGPGGPPMGPDWMHTNSVAYHPKLDQIMLSIHEFSEIWIIDHSTTTEEAASHKGGRYGMGGDLLYRWGNPRAYRNGANADQRLFAQHCAYWIAEGLPGAGHMLVFNNGHGRQDGTYSSADEVVLPVDEDGRYHREEYLAFGPDCAQWSYSEPEGGSFFSGNISGVQRLPNGNTFICSGAQGMLFEVTAEKEVVWKYSVPSHGHGGPGGPFGPGGPGGMRSGELFPSVLQDMLQLTDAQKEDLAELQDDVATDLSKLLTDEQREQLKNPMQPGPGGRPDNRSSDNRRANTTRGRRGMGGPGRFTPPHPGEVIPSMLVDSLDLTRAQTLQLAKLQKRVDSQVARILTKAQKSELDDMQRMFAGGPGGGPPGFGPPGSGGRGFGPGGGPPGFGPPGFGPPNHDRRSAGHFGGPDDQVATNDRRSRGPSTSDRPGFDRRDGGRERMGGGPGGPGGGPGGIFTCYRYGADYPGLEGKDLEPGEKLADLLSTQEGAGRPDNAR